MSGALSVPYLQINGKRAFIIDASKQNTFVGDFVGPSNTLGNSNTFMGNRAGYSNTIGSKNIFIGNMAGYSNDTADLNIFIGNQSGYSNTSGNNNTIIGSHAGDDNTSGHYNTFIGNYAGSSNIDGSSNTCIGIFSGFHNESGSGNVFLGNYAGNYEEGSNKLYIANSFTYRPLIYGEFDNKLLKINGDLYAIGDDGFDELGDEAIVTLGNVADHFYIKAVYGEGVKIGAYAVSDAFWIKQLTGRVGIGTDNPTRRLFVNGDAGGNTEWYHDSDERLKKNIKTIPDALDKVKKLRGVNFEWRDARTHAEGLQMGFIAQEVKNVIPEVTDKKREYYSMQYASITALLVEAIKEQQLTIDRLQRRLDESEKTKKKEIESLKDQFSDLQKSITTLLAQQSQLKNKALIAANVQ
jgi:hypothetical protein